MGKDINNSKDRKRYIISKKSGEKIEYYILWKMNKEQVSLAKKKIKDFDGDEIICNIYFCGSCDKEFCCTWEKIFCKKHKNSMLFKYSEENFFNSMVDIFFEHIKSENINEYVKNDKIIKDMYYVDKKITTSNGNEIVFRIAFLVTEPKSNKPRKIKITSIYRKK